MLHLRLLVHEVYSKWYIHSYTNDYKYKLNLKWCFNSENEYIIFTLILENKKPFIP